MRRLWVLVAGAVTVMAIVVGPGVAAASPSASRSTSACGDLVKKYQKASAKTAKLDLSNPKTLSKLYKQASVEFKALANSAPSSVQSAFKHLASAYAKLAKVDFSNPAALTSLETLGTKYANDFAKIGKYFAGTCKLHIPTSAVPST